MVKDSSLARRGTVPLVSQVCLVYLMGLIVGLYLAN
jgi:hypothetical protein